MFVPLPIPDVLPPSDVPRALTAAEFASRLQAQGRRVEFVAGRAWVEGRHRQWTPARAMEPVPLGEVQWPSRWAWGCRAVARDEASATTTWPWMVIRDLTSYGADRLDAERRRAIRRALEHCHFLILTDPGLLLQHGWTLSTSAAQRTGFLPAESESEYRAHIEEQFECRRPLVVAAFDDSERLVGYFLSHAVESDVSLDELVTANWVSGISVASALYWLSLRLWSAAPGTDTAWLGAPFPPREGIDHIKRSMGAMRVDVPMITRQRWPVRTYLRVARPDSHSRLG